MSLTVAAWMVCFMQHVWWTSKPTFTIIFFFDNDVIKVSLKQLYFFFSVDSWGEGTPCETVHLIPRSLIRRAATNFKQYICIVWSDCRLAASIQIVIYHDTLVSCARLVNTRAASLTTQHPHKPVTKTSTNDYLNCLAVSV